MYCSTDYTYSRRFDLEVNEDFENEIMVCEFIDVHNIKYIVIGFYRPPSAGKKFNINIKHCF